jgi:hypothetical protein
MRSMLSAITSRIPRRPLTPALARDRADEPAPANAPALDGEIPAGPEPEIRKIAQCLVVVIADVRRRDLVGRDVVPQGDGRRPHQILPRQLAADEIGVVREKQHASLEPHAIGQRRHGTLRETLVHQC